MREVRRTTMVIPSYWRPDEDPKQSETTGGPALEEEHVFDHPTPLRERGALPRLLDSLEILNGIPPREAGAFTIVVIAVPAYPSIAGRTAEKLEELIDPYRTRYEIRLLHHGTLGELRDALRAQGTSERACALVDLGNYAAVRNICSLTGILDGSDFCIFIDDDEVFTDPEFFVKAGEFVGAEHEGRQIRAVAGYYLQPETYRLDVSRTPAWRRPDWDNASAMNEACDLIIGKDPRLKPTSFVFGGNMVVERETLARIPFDPRITRGEDIDFLINLRVNGLTFWLDRELSIKHLPPASASPDWKKMREDARRFLYERKKVRDHRDVRDVSSEALMPYPGVFLGPDLEQRIIETSSRLREEYIRRGDDRGAHECDNIAALGRNDPYARFDTKVWLRELTEWWQELTGAAAGRGIPQ